MMNGLVHLRSVVFYCLSLFRFMRTIQWHPHKFQFNQMNGSYLPAVYPNNDSGARAGCLL